VGAITTITTIRGRKDAYANSVHVAHMCHTVRKNEVLLGGRFTKEIFSFPDVTGVKIEKRFRFFFSEITSLQKGKI